MRSKARVGQGDSPVEVDVLKIRHLNPGRFGPVRFRMVFMFDRLDAGPSMQKADCL